MDNLYLSHGIFPMDVAEKGMLPSCITLNSRAQLQKPWLFIVVRHPNLTKSAFLSAISQV